MIRVNPVPASALAVAICMALVLGCGSEETTSSTQAPTSPEAGPGPVAATPPPEPASGNASLPEADLPVKFPNVYVYIGSEFFGDPVGPNEDPAMTVFHSEDPVDAVVPALKQKLQQDGWLVDVATAEDDHGTVTASRETERVQFALQAAGRGTEISVMLSDLPSATK